MLLYCTIHLSAFRIRGHKPIDLILAIRLSKELNIIYYNGTICCRRDCFS